MSTASETIRDQSGVPSILSANKSSETAIEVRGLRKQYGTLEAVKGIDLTVKRGEIFGIMGREGAGKPPSFQMRGGVREPTAGEAKIFGKTTREARAFVGYLTQAFSLYQDLSVSENLHYMGQLRK